MNTSVKVQFDNVSALSVNQNDHMFSSLFSICEELGVNFVRFGLADNGRYYALLYGENSRYWSLYFVPMLYGYWTNTMYGTEVFKAPVKEEVKEEPVLAAPSFGRYRIMFYHSSDKYSSVHFHSDNKRKCMDELNRLFKYNASINIEMFKEYGADSLLCGIGYFTTYYQEDGSICSYGFRFWIEDSENLPAPKDLSPTSEAMDYDPSMDTDPVLTAIDSLKKMEEQLSSLKDALAVDLPAPKAVSMGLKHYYNAMESLKQFSYRLSEYKKQLEREQEEPVYSKYLAVWIADSDRLEELAGSLAALGVQSITTLQDGLGLGNIHYNLFCSDSELIEWRECLKRHNLEPFYIHPAN